MPFRHHRQLITFLTVVEQGSITAAANHLSLTKGAVSQQIKVLEDALGFPLFSREMQKLRLTAAGEQLLHAVKPAVDSIDVAIAGLSESLSRTVTLGLSTYLASRWLSPRLMTFMQRHPDISLRIQPMIDFSEAGKQGVDMVIQWGPCAVLEQEAELLFLSDAFPVANTGFMQSVSEYGLECAIANSTVLHDTPNSIAWRQWSKAEGIQFDPKQDTLIVPDPNVRVQSVIDGQGIAIIDSLLQRELLTGELHRLGTQSMSDYGYFLFLPARLNDEVKALHQWLKSLSI